ncbi:MAG: DUF5606 domain-containing protein [Flavobacteriales bacterium]|nr:DUF5606 domain-containing protein [Flavobacteriales bacterium]MCB9167670.1 DUF5606 domain-containing protein [Flavobacteriales bacterium]
MDLSKIISVAGKPGLYRVVAQGRQAVIAESLIDGKRIPVHASLRVSSLDEISMFTTNEDVPLKDVLEKLYAKNGGKSAADPKGDEGSLWKALGDVLPDMDRDRIYASDLRKLFSWYELLLNSGDLKPTEAQEDGAGQKDDGKQADKSPKKSGERPAKHKASGQKKKPAAAKPAGSKAKSTTVRKSAQRGS